MKRVTSYIQAQGVELHSHWRANLPIVLPPEPTSAAWIAIGHHNRWDLSFSCIWSEICDHWTPPRAIRDSTLEHNDDARNGHEEFSNWGAVLILIVDYDHNHPSSFSLLAIWKPTFVQPLGEPQEIDLLASSYRIIPPLPDAVWSANANFKTPARYAPAKSKSCSLIPFQKSYFSSHLV